MVWACGWGGGCVPLGIDNGENALGLWVGCELCTPGENCENCANGLGLLLGCGLWAVYTYVVKMVWACGWGVGFLPLRSETCKS